MNTSTHSSKKPFRVGLVSLWAGHKYNGSFLGVLDYGQHLGNWQIIGEATNPTLGFEEVDLSKVDGVIGLFHERHWADEVRKAGVAAVNISNRIADLPVPRVGNDDEAIGRLCAEHLVECGFTNFAFLGKPLWYSATRLEGFRSVITEQTGRPCHVLETQSEQTEPVRDWLARLPLPVAIMATDDHAGCILIGVALDLGLRVPNDVGVVGVNNDPWLTQLAPVTMSSVEPDWHQLGFRGAQILDRLMAGEAAPPPVWIPPLRLVNRLSTDALLTDDAVVTEALGLIRDQCGDGLSVAALARQLGISRRNLETRFRNATGQTPYAAVCRARIERAKGELVRTNATLAAIAQNCGLATNRLHILFKHSTGMTPGQYRARFGLRHSIQ